MFKLDKEISEWKKSLKKYKGYEDGYIAELESHLLDEIHSQKENGKSDQEAFEFSIEKLGFIDEVSDEYYKINKRKSTFNSDQSGGSSFSLLFSYIKFGARNFFKHKGYSFINVVGLGFSIAIVILLGLILEYETSFDDFHTNKDRIYKVYTSNLRNNEEVLMAPVTRPFAPTAKRNFEEIELAVRVKYSYKTLNKNEKRFDEGVIYADKSFFDLFSFKLLSGDKAEVLKSPNSVLLSEDYALKYFGKKDISGESILIDNKPFLVTGVYENMPDNSHLRQDVILSLETLTLGKVSNDWSWENTGMDYTYLLLRENSNYKELESKFVSMVNENMTEQQARTTKYFLQPLKDVHFSELVYESSITITKTTLWLFVFIGFFILLIACINFINLSTAKATERAKEIGLRKVTGASRLQIIRQFLTECIFISFIAGLVSLVFANFLLPGVNEFLRKSIEFESLFTFEKIGLLLLLIFITGILSGFYPAISLSRYDAALVLKDGLTKGRKGKKLRAILVVSQFVISIVIIVCNFIIFKQTEFMKAKETGFDSEGLLVVYLSDSQIRKNVHQFREEFLNSNYFLSASISSGTPFSGSISTSFFKSANSEIKDDVYLQILGVDDKFGETFDFKMAKGEFFNDKMSLENNNLCILNQTAVKSFGWKDPLNQIINRGDKNKSYQVIGVVKDFNYTSAKSKIKPTVLFLNTSAPYYLTLKLNPEFNDEGIVFLKETYAKFASYKPLNYFYLEDSILRHYSNEKQLFTFLIVCSILALSISCLGILGLVSFTINTKKKELGIRKVLGASSSKLFVDVSREFIKWVVISNLIAWPIGYLIMQNWLQNYSYKINFDFLAFAAAGSITILITLLSISFHTLKAVRENPVDALKYE